MDESELIAIYRPWIREWKLARCQTQTRGKATENHQSTNLFAGGTSQSWPGHRWTLLTAPALPLVEHSVRRIRRYRLCATYCGLEPRHCCNDPGSVSSTLATHSRPGGLAAKAPATTALSLATFVRVPRVNRAGITELRSSTACAMRSSLRCSVIVRPGANADPRSSHRGRQPAISYYVVLALQSRQTSIVGRIISWPCSTHCESPTEFTAIRQPPSKVLYVSVRHAQSMG